MIPHLVGRRRPRRLLAAAAGRTGLLVAISGVALAPPDVAARCYPEEDGWAHLEARRAAIPPRDLTQWTGWSSCPLHDVALETGLVPISHGFAALDDPLPLAKTVVSEGCVIEEHDPLLARVRFCPACREIQARAGVGPTGGAGASPPAERRDALVRLRLEVAHWWFATTTLPGPGRKRELPGAPDDSAAVAQIARALDDLRQLSADHPELAAMDARLRAHLTPLVAERAGQVEAALAGDRLGEARRSLYRLQELAGASERARTLEAQLARRTEHHLAAARRAIAARRFDEAEAALKPLLEVSGAEALRLHAEIKVVRRQLLGGTHIDRLLAARTWDADWISGGYLAINVGGVEPDQAGRLFFNASVAAARAGDCPKVHLFADRAAGHDDPRSPFPNRRWLASIERYPDCRSPEFGRELQAALAALGGRPK